MPRAGVLYLLYEVHRWILFGLYGVFKYLNLLSILMRGFHLKVDFLLFLNIRSGNNGPTHSGMAVMAEVELLSRLKE